MIEITQLAKDETERFKTIRLRSLRDDPDAFCTTVIEASVWPPEKWTAQMESIPTFLAVESEQDVGVVRVMADPDNSRVAWLISMWVAPEARGKKIGRALVDAAIDWAKQRGIEMLKLDVSDSNQPAISLYERKGFKPNGNAGSLPEPRTHIREHQRELQIRDFG